MALHTDVFEPKTIRSILKNLEKSSAAKEKFEKAWNENVEKRISSWRKIKDNKSTPMAQLQWEAEAVQYVDYLQAKLSVHGNSSASAKETPRILDRNIPFLGPHLAPPSFLHCLRRDVMPVIIPESAYIAPLTVVHPVFYPTALTSCPQCLSTNVRWDTWNASGARRVIGVRSNERAIGYQLRCNNCKEAKAPGGYCFAATNRIFWEKLEHWKIPRSVPYFTKRSAVTHELYDLIIELRPSLTSAGLAENFKQLHLLEYRQRMLEYLSYFNLAPRQGLFKRNDLQKFSLAVDEHGYNNSYVTNDLITEIYLDFIAKGRQSESIEYCKTRTAKSISLDNTFKSAGKASIVEKDGRRQNPMKGGILSAINEEGEGIAWRYCMSNSPAESRELLHGIGLRHDFLGLPRPPYIIVDNCCMVRRYLVDGLGQDTHVLLDVYHFMMRYGAVVFGGTKNPHCREVLVDIRDAIVKRPAKANQPALYWTQPEQEERIIAMYNKWLRHGNVWSAAASKVHADQLEHVRKGCLARPREDIAMDGSRIEGSHKAWNSLQRAQPSGIEVYTGLAHDFFLCRNICVASSRIQNHRSVNCGEFIASAQESHHVRLVCYTSELFNSLYEKEPPASKANLTKYPILPKVQVNEMIGIVKSAHSVTFGGHNDEEKPEDLDTNILLQDIDAQVQETDQAQFIASLGVDQRLISLKMAQISVGSSSAAPSTLAATSVSVDTVLTENSTPSIPVLPSQKRKECMPHSTTSLEDPTTCTDGMPNSKRRRHAGPPSPSTSALHLPNLTLHESGGIELDETLEPQDSPDKSGLIDFEPIDSVIATDVPISLPTTPSSTPATMNTPQAFFRFQGREGSMHAAPVPSNELPLEALRRPLPIPVTLRNSGLTRSQLLFSVGTSIDPRALRITGDDEFYLFMDMRAEFQWTSFGMTASKWASAAKIYNERLKDLMSKKNSEFIKKNPRALADKLSEIEPKISERIAKGDYCSTKSHTETFWKKHCAAVPALTVKTEGGEGNGDDPLQKKRRPAVCTRCKARMYPGDKNLNHRKGVCADGVAQKPKTGSSDPLPEWPQPQGIFSAGKFFDPLKFLITVRDLYEKVTEQTERGAHATADYLLEDEAFSRMLKSRTIFVEGHALFRLYDLELVGGGESLISEIEGCRYLRMDCL